MSKCNKDFVLRKKEGITDVPYFYFSHEELSHEPLFPRACICDIKVNCLAAAMGGGGILWPSMLDWHQQLLLRWTRGSTDTRDAGGIPQF